MKLSQLSAKPKLAKLVIDDEDTVKEYGEAVEFYSWDRQPIDTFLKLASLNPDNQGEMIAAVKDLIMDEDGKPIINKDNTIPTNLLMKVITKVVETLGKS